MVTSTMGNWSFPKIPKQIEDKRDEKWAKKERKKTLMNDYTLVQGLNFW